MSGELSENEARLRDFLRRNPPYSVSTPPQKDFVAQLRAAVERGLAEPVPADDEPDPALPISIPPKLATDIDARTRAALRQSGDSVGDRYRSLANEVFVKIISGNQPPVVPPRTLFLAIAEVVFRVHEETARLATNETHVDSQVQPTGPSKSALTTLTAARTHPQACLAGFVRLRELEKSNPDAFQTFLLHGFTGRRERELEEWDGDKVYKLLVAAEKEVVGQSL